MREKERKEKKRKEGKEGGEGKKKKDPPRFHLPLPETQPGTLPGGTYSLCSTWRYMCGTVSTYILHPTSYITYF